MKDSIVRQIWGGALLALSPLALAAEPGATPAGLVTRVGVIGLVVFAAIVVITVYFLKQRDKKTASVQRVAQDKQAKIHSVEPDVLVSECVRQMNSKKIGAMLVMEGERLVGIFTERDALRGVLGAGRDPNTTKVAEVMTKDPYAIAPTATVEEALSIVTDRRFRHLPVVDNDKVVALISSGDLTHWLVQDKVQEIQDLVEVAGKS